MSKIFHIGLFDENDNVLNWFQSYDNIISKKVIDEGSAKVFFEYAHAQSCVDQFIKTSKNNKSKTHENKWEEFLEKYPLHTIKIMSNECNNVFHIVEINLNGENSYLKFLNKESKELTLTKNIKEAYEYIDYEKLKEDCKFGYQEKFFTNSQVTVLTKFE